MSCVSAIQLREEGAAIAGITASHQALEQIPSAATLKAQRAVPVAVLSAGHVVMLQGEYAARNRMGSVAGPLVAWRAMHAVAVRAVAEGLCAGRLGAHVSGRAHLYSQSPAPCW